MKSVLLILSIFLFSFYANGQNEQINKKKFYDGKFDSQDTTFGYTDAVQAGNMLYISGTVGNGTIAQQLRRIYTDLGNILKAYGATYQNVVKETLYTTDMDAVKENNDVRKAFYNNDFPAATWVQISRLFSSRKDAQIEVDLIACLPVKVREK